MPPPSARPSPTPTPSPSPPPPIHAIFGAPTADSDDATLAGALLRLIALASPGSEIRVAIFEWTALPFATALAQARDRDVDVQVVLDGGGTSAAVLEALRSGLGPAQVHVCGDGAEDTACIGNKINHNKFFLFSALDDGSAQVVVQSSANLNAGMYAKHNNAIVLRGDTPLYAFYRDYWGDLRTQREDLDYYRTLRGDSGAKAYFFPRASGDTILSVLDNVHCDPGAELHLGMAMFTDGRREIAERLADKRRAGCSVRAIIGVYPGVGSPGPRVMDTLRGAGVSVKTLSAPNIHSKYLLVRDRYGEGSQVERLVFTGSHNYTRPALRRNDEALLRVGDPAVYEAFRRNWQRLWDQP